MLPYLTANCLQAYGLRGAMLLLGVLSCHLIPIGFTMRPPRQSKKDTNRELVGSATGGETGEAEHSDPKLLPRRNIPVNDDLEAEPQNVGQGQKSGDGNHGKNYANEETSWPHDIPTLHSEHPSSVELDEYRKNHRKQHEENDRREGLNEMDRRRRGPKYGGGPNHMSNSKSRISKVVDVLLSVFDLRALKDEPAFTFILLPCQFFIEICWISWMFFMVSYAVSQGMSEQRAVFLPIAGNLGAICGRVVVAVVMYRKHDLAQLLIAVNSAVRVVRTPVVSSKFIDWPFNTLLLRRWPRAKQRCNKCLSCDF